MTRIPDAQRLILTSTGNDRHEMLGAEALTIQIEIARPLGSEKSWRECTDFNWAFVTDQINLAIPSPTVYDRDRAHGPIDRVCCGDMIAVRRPRTAPEIRRKRG